MTRKPSPVRTPPAGRREAAPPPPPAPFEVTNARCPRCGGPVYFFPAGHVVLCPTCKPLQVG